MKPTRIRTLESHLVRSLTLAAALGAAAGGVRADEFHLFSGPGEPARAFADPGLEHAEAALHLEIAPPLEAAWSQDAGAPAAAAPELTAPPPKLFTTGTTLVTAGALVGGFLQGLGAPLQYGWVPFNTTNEGWFGRDTYVGGSDKVSHFIISSGVSRALYEAYTAQGHSKEQSFNLALATTFMAGSIVEIMDGVSVYGFSFQDLTVDALGAAAGLLIQRNGLEDMLGLRLGLATTDVPPIFEGGSVETLGHSYNDEIYAADFKPAGLVRRLGGKPGFERFFLTSFVFFTRGYGYDPPLPTRYQEIGFEVGLNFPEILRAFGVNEKTWWGTGLIAIFNFFRFPYTQVGVYYNMFDKKWYGPGAPYHYY
jgi:uncharacterized protein YfiM (DUF2279 family)